MIDGANAKQLFDMVKLVYDGQTRLHLRLDEGQHTIGKIQTDIAEVRSDVGYLKRSDEKRATHIDQLHERITRIETNESRREGEDLHGRVVALETDVEDLKTTKQQQRGAWVMFTEFLRHPITWLATGAATLWAVVTQAGGAVR